MPASRSAPVVETVVHKVFAALTAADDFLSLTGLAEASGCSRHEVVRSLHHLRKYRAVDSVESSGELWWFATPETDTRTRTFDERRKEDEPRMAVLKRHGKVVAKVRVA